jgi:hypothetical protein
MYCSDIFGEYICPPFSVFVIGIRFLLVGFNTLIAGGNRKELCAVALQPENQTMDSPACQYHSMSSGGQDIKRSWINENLKASRYIQRQPVFISPGTLTSL